MVDHQGEGGGGSGGFGGGGEGGSGGFGGKKLLLSLLLKNSFFSLSMFSLD